VLPGVYLAATGTHTIGQGEMAALLYGGQDEVDSREWHTSPEDHARTLARGRRMSRHQIIVLRFTPKQIRTEPAQVLQDIRRTLDGARSRLPLNLRTVPAAGPGPAGRRRGQGPA
jgi:hypothetical protein